MCRNLYMSILLLFTCVEAAAMGSAEDMKRLLVDLFNDYDSKVRPSYNYSRPTEVDTRVHVMAVIDMDIKTQTLKLRGFLQLLWTDEFLRWDPKDYAGITEILVPQNNVWKPDAMFPNGIAENTYIGEDKTQVSVKSGGLIAWEPFFNLDLACKVDALKYPFDETICPISVQAWTSNNETVKMLFPKYKSPLNLQYLLENGMFEVSPAGTHKHVQKYRGKFYETINFNLRLSRRSACFMMVLLLPVTVLSLLCVVSFIVPPDEPDKIPMSLTALLSFTIFLGVIDDDMPENHDHLPLIIIHVALLQLLSFLGVVGNVSVRIIHKWDQEKGTEDDLQCSANIINSVCNRPLEFHTDIISTDSRVPVENSKQIGSKKNLPLFKQSRAFRLNKILLALNSFALVFITAVIMIFMTS